VDILCPTHYPAAGIREAQAVLNGLGSSSRRLRIFAAAGILPE